MRVGEYDLKVEILENAKIKPDSWFLLQQWRWCSVLEIEKIKKGKKRVKLVFIVEMRVIPVTCCTELRKKDMTHPVAKDVPSVSP